MSRQNCRDWCNRATGKLFPAILNPYVIFGFRLEWHEISTLLGHYAVYSSNSLPTFRDNLSFPSVPFKIRPIGRPETPVRNRHYKLCNVPVNAEFRLNPTKCVKRLRSGRVGDGWLVQKLTPIIRFFVILGSENFKLCYYAFSSTIIIFQT